MGYETEKRAGTTYRSRLGNVYEMKKVYPLKEGQGSSGRRNRDGEEIERRTTGRACTDTGQRTYQQPRLLVRFRELLNRRVSRSRHRHHSVCVPTSHCAARWTRRRHHGRHACRGVPAVRWMRVSMAVHAGGSAGDAAVDMVYGVRRGSVGRTRRAWRRTHR